MLISEFVEDLAEFLEIFLVFSGIELKRAFHDSAVVEIGDIDDVCFSGVSGSSFLGIFFTELWEKGDDDSHEVIWVDEMISNISDIFDSYIYWHLILIRLYFEVDI